MSAAPGLRQEGAFQVGPQQQASPRLMLGPCLPQHLQGHAQLLHAAGHQGGRDRFHPIAPEQLQEFLQLGQVGRGELREGKPQAAVDL